MSKLKYIILSIVSAITNPLPISYKSHITIYKKIFNTQIFNDQNILSFLNLSLIIAILIISFKDIFYYFKAILKKSKNKKKHRFIKLLTISSIINLIIFPLTNLNIKNIKLIAIFFIFTSIIILFSTNKKGHKNISQLNFSDSIIIGLSSIITIIPTISHLCSNLFICSKRKIDKNTSFIYSTLCYIPILFINSIKGTTYLLNNQAYFIDYMISLIISSFISFYILNYLKKLYMSNKIYKLSIYCLLLTIFLFIWFR